MNVIPLVTVPREGLYILTNRSVLAKTISEAVLFENCLWDSLLPLQSVKTLGKTGTLLRVD